MADLQTKLKKRLEAMLKLPDNLICADCRKRGPRWASANLGIFICIECSGIHRNLGVHISFVRSVNLDSWTLVQVEHMEQWGNKRANEYYEANLPPHVIRPKEGDAVRTVERFIRDKYEHKRYIGKHVPPANTAAAAVATPSAASESSARTPVAPKSVSARPTPVPVAVATPAPVVSLLDFDEPVAAPTAAAFPVAASVANHDPFGSNDFGDFATAGGAPPVPSNNGFGDFQSPPQHAGWGAPVAAAPVPPVPPMPVVPAKPQISATDILGMYGGHGIGGPMGMGQSHIPPMGGHPQMGVQGGHPQNPFQHQQPFGMHPGMQQYPGMQQAHMQQQMHPGMQQHMQQQQQHAGMHQHGGMQHHQGMQYQGMQHGNMQQQAMMQHQQGMQQQHPGMHPQYGQQSFGQAPANPFAQQRPAVTSNMQMQMQGGAQMMGQGYPQQQGFQHPGGPAQQQQQQQPQQSNQQQQHAFSQLSWTNN